MQLRQMHANTEKMYKQLFLLSLNSSDRNWRSNATSIEYKLIGMTL